MFRQKYQDFHIDTLVDQQVLSDQLGMLKHQMPMVGGGISNTMSFGGTIIVAGWIV